MDQKAKTGEPFVSTEGMSFGELLQHYRKERGLTLRDFCTQNGFDPGNQSRLERGRAKAPTEDRVLEYAAALQIAEGTAAHQQFVDAAAISRSDLEKIVPDRALLNLLPAYMRTINDKKLTKQELIQLVEFLRNS